MDIFKAVVQRIKNFIQGQDKKKLIENTAIVIIIGIILIIAGSALFAGKPRNAVQEPRKQTENADIQVQNSGGADTTEARLRTLLSQMQGVGRVDVMITYSAEGEDIPAYDTNRKTSRTDEKDSEGGTRNTYEDESDNTLVYEDSPAGGKTPVILKRLGPEVKGVLVVAEGADSVTVRERIVSAVRVVLDIPAHRVEVIQRKK
ncbi:MAG TPA: stage III sporulation protein AG [Clostridia bacterium]|nr:stage III sporulation protein AG [Clostridia bacterium]